MPFKFAEINYLAVLVADLIAFRGQAALSLPPNLGHIRAAVTAAVRNGRQRVPQIAQQLARLGRYHLRMSPSLV